MAAPAPSDRSRRTFLAATTALAAASVLPAPARANTPQSQPAQPPTGPAAPPLPSGMNRPPFSPLARHWRIDPNTVFLNHGSFGAVPNVVAARQAEIHRLTDLDPIKFFVDDLEPMLDDARRACAALVGCNPDDFAFVSNATTGVNTVVRSLEFKPGDELLTSSQEYNACNNALKLVADRSGAVIKSVELPFPVRSPDEIAQLILAGVTPRTRLVLLSHITSPTGLILPVETIVAECNRRGVDVLVDGAHAPAHIPLNVEAIGCPYYTGNFHKWACAPKGSAFLYVRPDRQKLIRPLTISHGANSPRTDRSHFRLEFDFTGTGDYSPFLATPASLELLPRLAAEAGAAATWDGFRAANRAMTLKARDRVCNALGVEPPAPDEMLGFMAAIILPLQPEAVEKRLAEHPPAKPDPLHASLMERHAIQIPVGRAGPLKRRTIRLSAMLYNTPEQYDHLAAALKEELARERRA